MNNPERQDVERQDEQIETPSYERPSVVDHGSLAELTLHTSGSYTDGHGFGGGS